MSPRDKLGPVDVNDETLAEMLCADGIVESQVEDVDYAWTTLTTGSRWWVSGTARQDGVDIPFRLFVKVVQSALRSPAMAGIPPQFHEMIADALPWHVEPNAYRSDLAIRVPSGMRIPRAVRVAEIDDDSCALWLEAVEHDESPWTLDRYHDAAAMLGRFAGAGTCPRWIRISLTLPDRSRRVSTSRRG